MWVNGYIQVKTQHLFYIFLVSGLFELFLFQNNVFILILHFVI